MALQRGRSAEAINILQPALRYDFSWFGNGLPNYIRGLTFLGQHDGQNALAEFDKILSHRYLFSVETYYALAQLGAARAAALTGDTALSRIHALLDASRGREWACRPRPRLAEPDLLAWETAQGVALPQEYRRFLRDVGDGGGMPGPYCDFEITPLAGVRGGPGAARPFPITAERLGGRFGNSRPRAGQPTGCCSPG